MTASNDASLVYLYLLSWANLRHQVRTLREIDKRWEDLPILRIGGDGSESLDHAHARADPPKDCVLIIKIRCWSQGQEELRSWGNSDNG